MQPRVETGRHLRRKAIARSRQIGFFEHFLLAYVIDRLFGSRARASSSSAKRLCQNSAFISIRRPPRALHLPARCPLPSTYCTSHRLCHLSSIPIPFRGRCLAPIAAAVQELER
ncbi:hypothetical protein BS78_08G128400 [Paspalum vaginatum]|nr:hypothetical protein BS78_08G128400 [Paspalum vaginatum]